MMKRMLALSMAATVAVACTDADQMTGPEETEVAPSIAGDLPGTTRTYEVTITNLTTGQPFSPGVLATHFAFAKLLRYRGWASEGLRLIAENGDPSEAAAELAEDPRVFDHVVIGAPIGCDGCPGPFASEATFAITARANARFLTMALMLICTNDGFVGLNRVPLPRGKNPRTFYARAYDAGTEANTETWESLVDPCGAIGPVEGPQDGMNERQATHRRIRPHGGIRGDADLSDAHDWRGPVAKVTIQQID